MIFQTATLSYLAISWVGQIGFAYIPGYSDYWIAGFRTGMQVFLYIVSLYFTFSIRRNRNHAEIAID